MKAEIVVAKWADKIECPKCTWIETTDYTEFNLKRLHGTDLLFIECRNCWYNFLMQDATHD